MAGWKSTKKFTRNATKLNKNKKKTEEKRKHQHQAIKGQVKAAKLQDGPTQHTTNINSFLIFFPETDF